MFSFITLVIAIVVLLFGFVLLYGAPYLPTLKKSTTEALDLLDLKPGQTLLELGSGDGRVLRAAAKRGIYSVGYELNPLLVIWSTILCWSQRKYIKIIWGNFWNQKLQQSDGIYVFLLDRYMKKLDTKITQEISKKVRVVSFGFEIPGKKPIKKLKGLHVYEYSPK